jgi:hypothetical protein
MRSHINWAAGLLGAIAVVAVAAPAHAVKTDVDGYLYDLPDGAKNNLAPLRVLIEASDAMGLTRNNGNALNCIGCTLPSFQLMGKGTYGGVDNATVRIDYDYRIQAVRADVTGADKKRTVLVAAKGLVWDESEPGKFAKTATQPALERLLPVYLYPTAAVYLGGLAPDKVQLSTNPDGQRVLSIPLADYKADLKATVSGKGFITKIELAYGGKTYTAEYSQFDNDRVDNHIFLPNRIVQKVDGKVMTDLTLDYHWGNPYMLFRAPKEVASK